MAALRAAAASSAGVCGVVSIPPHQYVHILDTNSNVTRLITGPVRYTGQESERLIDGPLDYITLPPRTYVVISNPVMRGEPPSQAGDEEKKGTKETPLVARGEALKDEYDQYRLRHGDTEVRMADEWTEPFPLYPGEELLGDIQPVQVVKKMCALKLRASRQFVDDVSVGTGSPDSAAGAGSAAAAANGSAPTPIVREAGDEWLFFGPATLKPRIEVEVVEEIASTIVKSNRALRLRALRETTDRTGTKRKAGEEWLVRASGAFMPSIDEQIVEVVSASVITERDALMLRAKKPFTDVYGIARRAGEDWLVTPDLSSQHICDIDEEIIRRVPVTTLSNRQWCVIIDPFGPDEKQRLGTKELRRGETSFFLRPGESLDGGIRDVYVLGDDEALLLQATECFVDDNGCGAGPPTANGGHGKWTIVGSEGGGDADQASAAGAAAGKAASGKLTRSPGDRWMVYGPTEFVPPIEVKIVEERRAIPLDENEGIYVRNLSTGKVRAVIGATYMLAPDEELYEKELSAEVELLLARQSLGQTYIPAGAGSEDGDDCGFGERDRTRVVKMQVPHNTALQVFDYKVRNARVIFGPEQVMLMPDEQFSVMRLSGDKPKRPNVITSLCLNLGPDFMTDIVTVETSDHARLRLTLSYNWHFDVTSALGGDADAAGRIFSVRDFTGDACKSIASRVRGAVAMETFDNFHKMSAKIIRNSVFGTDAATNRVRDEYRFVSNNLIITNVDIQSVEPVDASTRESLQKSVQMAIEITINSQEARAKHEALREAEEAKGTLHQQQLQNEAHAERHKKELLQLRAESSAIETSGQAKSEAAARAEAAEIEGRAAVEQARLRAEAMRIEAEAQITRLQAEQEAEVAHRKALDELELSKQRALAQIEAEKFGSLVTAIGPDTIAAIARAGPEMQAKLLQGLGLSGMLVTDGKSPINLLQTAQGLVGQLPGQAPPGGGMPPPPPPGGAAMG